MKIKQTKNINKIKLTLFFVLMVSLVTNAQNSVPVTASLVDNNLHGHPVSFNNGPDSAVLKEGNKVPDFDMVDTSGKHIKLSSLRGKYVVLDIWASYCLPCIKEYPKLADLRNKLKGDNIVFISISCDGIVWKWLGSINGYKMQDANQWLIVDKSFMKAFQVDRIPRFILIDKEGRLFNNNLTKPSLPETEEYLKNLKGI